MTEFTEGMEVIVWPYAGWEYNKHNAPYIKKVAKANARFVVRDDGSKWTTRGRKWASTGYGVARIEIANGAERAHMADVLAGVEKKERFHKARDAIEKVAGRMKRIPLDKLEEIASLCARVMAEHKDDNE